MEQQLFSLKTAHTKTMLVDDSFWEKVRFVIFHSEFLEVVYTKGRPLRVLHHGFFEILNSSETSYSDAEIQRIYKELGVAYRFPEDNEAFLDALYTTAQSRGLQRYLYEEEVVEWKMTQKKR